VLASKTRATFIFLLRDAMHRAVEVGFKKPRFLGFKKPLKTAKAL